MDDNDLGDLCIDTDGLTAAETILAQLRDGGRLAAGIVEDGVTRVAIGRKAGDGFGMAAVADAATAILPGFLKPRGFTF